ncbi:MAG TPA: hypothetical protein VME44_15020 [Streptosporangiaceae bacterium]|nr:hypothetical protein [Streptosporangiaceae bacterium]
MNVQPVSVAEVADELYALSPAEFTAARDDRARQARASGQRDEAAAIKKLARPTASAWLVNQLTRTAPDSIARLVAVGTALAEAQRNLVGERLRELSTERRQVINDLLPRAIEIASQAGQPASPGTMGEVRATLEAALADAGARAAVQSGRLTKALAYAGLGEVDLSAAVALPGDQAPPGRKPAGQMAVSQTAVSQTAVSQTAEDLAAAEEAAQTAVENAERALEAADGNLAAVAEQRQFLRRRIKHLERELGQAKEEDAQLAKDGQQAQRSRDAAARELQAATRRLGQAQKRAADSSHR